MKTKIIILSILSLILSLCNLGMRMYRKYKEQPIVISTKEEMVCDDISYKILDLSISDIYYDKTTSEDEKFYIVTVQITNNSEEDYKTYIHDWMMVATDPNKNNIVLKDNSVGAGREFSEGYRQHTIHPKTSYNDVIAFRLPKEMENIELKFYENELFSDKPYAIFEFE